MLIFLCGTQTLNWRCQYVNWRYQYANWHWRTKLVLPVCILALPVCKLGVPVCILALPVYKLAAYLNGYQQRPCQFINWHAMLYAQKDLSEENTTSLLLLWTCQQQHRWVSLFLYFSLLILDVNSHAKLSFEIRLANRKKLLFRRKRGHQEAARKRSSCNL